jgi:TRAP-type mannitol/chloroaromatic compound transport system permease large subunit
LLPLLLIIDLVLGSIYGGVTTISEAAAMGVVASLIVIFLRRELEVVTIMGALEQMFRSVGAILWVTFGATVLAGAFTLSGGAQYVSTAILDLNAPPTVVILMMLLVFFILGLAFLTPPFGSAAFYLKSVAPPDIDLVTIYRSFGPFILLQIAILTVLVAFPEISLFLVR